MSVASSKHANTLVDQTNEENAKFAAAVAAANRSLAAADLGDVVPPREPRVPNATTRAPELNERARGWLKWMYRKSTTPDDWSATGEPHEWWDKYTGAPMTSFQRFDLVESAYALVLMADKTPAWRGAYSRILDELTARHTTHWAAVDWLNQFGHDPDRARYPKAFEDRVIRKDLMDVGYDTPGWTANDTYGMGVQPDPVAAEAMLFFKGWFTMLMASAKYVSGSERWERVWLQEGVAGSKFEWTLRAMASHLEGQFNLNGGDGLHWENVKVWPTWLAAAGLGLQMFDKVTPGSAALKAVNTWVENALRPKYFKYDEDGSVTHAAMYHMPREDKTLWRAPSSGLSPAWYILPYAPELSRALYEGAVKEMGWRDQSKPIQVTTSTFRGLVRAKGLAQEFGDELVAERLRQVLDVAAEPKWFGEEDAEFGFFCHLRGAQDDRYPRGQLTALLMVSEVCGMGDWSRAFNAAPSGSTSKFDSPSVEDVDFPASLGISTAWNDEATGELIVRTYATLPSRTGEPTSFLVTKIPSATWTARGVRVTCDGAEHSNWSYVNAQGGECSIEVRGVVGTHGYAIYTGHVARSSGKSRL